MYECQRDSLANPGHDLAKDSTKDSKGQKMRTEDFGAELQKAGFSDFVGVPCSYLAPLINWAINENAFIMANNEGEAVAIASGISLACALPLSDKSGSASAHSLQRTASASHSFASHNPNFSSQMLPHESTIVKNSSDSWQSTKNNRKYGVVLMQNSGLSNALSPLTSLNHTFNIPILGFVSLRGEPNENGVNTDEPQHELLGRITDKLLQTCEVECAFLDSNLEVAKQQLSHAKAVLESNKSFFFIVRNNCFEKVALANSPCSDFLGGASAHSLQRTTSASHSFASHNPKNSSTMLEFAESVKPTRLQALQTIQNLGQNCALLATTGKCGRELYELDDKENQLYMVGSMGCVSALGLGIAIKSPKKIIAIDGDSALLMRLGALSGNAYYARNANKGNFCHILLDNQSHDSTGGQFNLSPFVDFVAVAKSCGYEVAKKAQDLDEFSAILAEFLEAQNGGAYFIYLDLAKGSKKDLGRPKITPKQVAVRFSAWLNKF